jgi:hypothetical protein
LLDDLLGQAGNVSDELADLRNRLTVEPTDAPFNGLPRQRLRSFLVRIGVRTGLHPDPVPRSTVRGEGRAFEAGYDFAPASLPQATASTWRLAIASQLPSGLRPYTTYLS